MNDTAFVFLLFAINVAIFAVTIWSVARILGRLGLSKWWTLGLFAWMVTLPLLAVCRWPALDGKPDSKS